MKVDTTKLKKSSSELTPECRQLIEHITNCHSRAELLQFLDTVHVWLYGKCELYHWIDILDRFDTILEEAARSVDCNEYVLYCDTNFGVLDTKLLLLVLNFTTLLIEHSFSRHLYNSVEHLTQLLSSENMDIVLAVLNLLYMFSKRSNFIPRLSFDKKEMLLIKLFNIAERWGDPNYGLALIDCCTRKPKLEFLYQLFIEYMDDKGHMTLLEIPDMMGMCARATPATVTKAIIDEMVRPSAAVKMRIAHRVRLVSGFKNDKLRLQFVQARLQAVSVLIYSNALNDNTEKVLYPGFGEELCELIDKEDVHLVEIRAAVLRTLTAMLHFDRNPNVPRPASRLPKIIQYTGAERQSGILPLLVRDCIASLTGGGNSDKYPLILATSLFSLLYHLASYEIGGHALVKSGMMQSLLRVINWPGMDLEHITFVTRAVRVIDLITNIDIAKFHQNNGLNVFIDRLEKEVNSCRKLLDEKSIDNNIEVNIRPDGSDDSVTAEGEQSQNAEGSAASEEHDDNIDEMMPVVNEEMPGQRNLAGQVTQRRRHSADSDVVILDEGNLDSPSYSPTSEIASGLQPTSPNSQGESSNNATSATNPEESRDAGDMDGDQTQYPANSYYSRPFNERNAEYNQMLQTTAAKRPACVTQRAALLKSMLNFLKKSIQDHSHFNGMRNIMETSLPNSLRHIISNAEYYGPSLFLLATDVVTVYVFNEPSLLSSLQDSGLTTVMLQSLLRKDVPATREVLGSLPNVFSALCLNERGLMEFMAYEPFDKMLKVLLSPDYLVAMRRRRSSDPMGDTATNLGNSMDDLMKHHPYLRNDATEAIVRLLNELVRLGSDINFVCWRANKDTNAATGNNINATSGNVDTNQVNQGGVEGNAVASNNADAAAAGETEHDSSGEDDDDDDEMSSASQQQSSTQPQQHRQNRATPTNQPARSQTLEREAIPLIDYILNVMKFVEAIFSNSSNGEHCHEFVLHGGLKPLLQLLSLPNLPVDSPVSTTAQAVANVCKSILNLAHETKVIDTALQQLSQIVAKLKPLIRNFSFPGGSVLLCELLSCPRPEDGFSIAEFTPLLHAMSSVHGYVVMLVCLCRNASSNEMRSMLLMRWGAKTESGLYLLQHLVQLYISLVWESTILLNLCSEEPFSANSASDWNMDEMCSMLPLIRETPKDANAMDVVANAGDQITPEQKFERSATAFKAKLKPEDQLRYIKSLLAASSRLGRALAELFGTLVKLSVGTPQSRQRRNNEYVPPIGTKSPADAKEIARVLSSILVNGFQHENIMPKPAPKLKLTFLICSVGFTGPMLFDDKRNAFHLMLSQFCEENGLKAYFDMFYWALSLDNPPSKFSYEQCLNTANLLEDHEDDERDLPEGTSEFLDAWLQLLEKMVNPRAIIDSPYSIVNVVKFESTFYMVHVHQLALHAIRRIWKRKPLDNYAVSMTETMMAILKHLAKFHSVLRVQYNQRVEELATAAKKKEKEAAEDAGDVNKDHLKLLTDMGFASQHVIEALFSTRTLEEATDFLLNLPLRECSTPTTGGVNAATVTEPSAGTNPSNAMEVDAVPTANAVTINNTDCLPSTSSGISGHYAMENKPKIDYTKLTLISEKTFAEFCKQALERTFCFMETLPEVIVTVGAELIYVLYKRHSLAERHLFVLNLARDLGDLTQQITRNLPTLPMKQREMRELIDGGLATKLFIRLKVSTILLEETYADMRKDYCMELVHEETLSSLIMLLKKSVDMLDIQADNGEPVQPCWLQVLIEFIDALDNVCTILQRKANMRAVSSETWKWYDSSAGKWNAYSEANNTIIRNAFNLGERSVNINIGRQRYTVNFNCMKQVSEASGTHRQVLPSLKITEALCCYATGNPHYRPEKIITRTIRTRPDGKGVVQHDELLCLQSLLSLAQSNIHANKTSNTSASGGVGAGGSGVGGVIEEARRIATQTAYAAVTNASRPMAMTASGELPQRTPTPPLILPPHVHIRPGANSMHLASSPQTATTASVTPTTSSMDSGTAAPQADDLSMSSSAKKSKIKPNSAQKTTGATAKKPTPADRVKRIILREENIGLALFDTPEIVACLTRMLRPLLRIDFETKVSVLKLCARLTKDYKNARAFYKHNGIQRLLNMRQNCGFMGFPTFAIVIIRHLMEPPPVLQDAIERILSVRTWPSLPVGHRDLIFLLTQVSSAVARHPKIFLAAAKQILRCDYTFSLMESRFLVRSALASNRRNNPGDVNSPTNQTQTNVQNEIITAAAATMTSTTANNDNNTISSTAIDNNKATSSNSIKGAAKTFEDLSDIGMCIYVVKDLLRAVVQPCLHYGGVVESDMEDLFQDTPPQGVTPSATTSTVLDTSTKTNNNKKQGANNGQNSATPPQLSQEKVEPCCCSWHIPTNTHWHKKPVLPRATLLKVLADSVRSYQSLIPRIIVEHVYTPDDSILVDKNQTFLSFILDKFLPIVRPQQDAEVSMMSRVLIASLADCYGQSAVQVKVVEEIHAALVRILSLPDSSEKHTRLQVVIGLLPTLIENPLLWSKAHLQRNHMYRILLRQGIMTDLTKIAQYKDLSNSNTVNTIYSILRPMEILLRLTVTPGPLSNKRLYFSPGHGMNSMLNRRFYPRFLARAGAGAGTAFHAEGAGNGGSGSGRETVLRDIIRNVFSDRRSHAFDILMNSDGLFVDSEETSPNNGTSGEDDGDENDIIQNTFSRGDRANMNLDRLWDDLIQSDGLRLVRRTTGAHSGSGNDATGSNADTHRHNGNDDGSGNNDTGAGGGSDGASSTSEIVAAVAENAASLMAEVSTSDSDSESNASTENDERHDDEDEDDVVVDANDPGNENQSETDADEESAHRFIQVFQRHIYEPESSETASNDADVDGDEEDADMESRAAVEVRVERNVNDSNDDIPALIPLEESSSISALASEDAPMSEADGSVAARAQEPSSNPSVAQPQVAVNDSNSESNSTTSNASVATQNTVSAANTSTGSVRTLPTFSWMTSRISAFDGPEPDYRALHIGSTLNNERQVNNATARSVPLAATGANTQPPVGTPAGMSSGTANTVNFNAIGREGANGLRRDQARRLVFLDQQYCAPMPSYHNPTEEGQMELFNQDALHWWLEEAKHLDLESQTDACMYVAHLIVPHLIRELKVAPNQKKNETVASNNTAAANSATNSGGNNRRSAIPVLIHSSTGNVIANGTANTAETRNAELSTPALPAGYLQIRFPRRELRAMERFLPDDLRPMRLNLLSDDDIDAEAEAEAEAETDADVDVDPDAEAEAEVEARVEAEAEVIVEAEFAGNRQLNAGGLEEDDDEEEEEDDDDEEDEDVFSDGVEEDGLGDDEDDEFDDDVEEEGMGDDEDADLNSTFNGEEHLRFDWEDEALEALEREAISNMTVRPPMFNRPRPASAPASTLAARTSSESNDSPATNNEPIAEVEEESQTTNNEAARLEGAEDINTNSPASNAQEDSTPEADRMPPTPASNEISNESSNAASSSSNDTNVSTVGSGSERSPDSAAESTEENTAVEAPASTAAAVVNTNTVDTTTTTSNENVEAVATIDAATIDEGVENVTSPAGAGAAVAETGTEATAAGGAAAVIAANIPEMSPEVRAALGDLVVPEGVDPSFLAALPSEMREEVIQEHLRMQRVLQRAQQNAIQVAHDALVEVNPEFLAALPPNIQSEVLMQQRIEQQRQAAQNSNPEDPVDTAAFFQNLPENLRQAILTDMEDSQIASLPPDLAAEAQYLRRDWEARNGARLDANPVNTLYSRWHTNSIWYDANGTPTNPPHHHATIVHHHQHHQMHGKPIALLLMEEDNILLDPDSLATLLLFLFIEDGKMNYARLHRVIRNLCYHVPTREWVINALISIIKRTNESELNGIRRKRVKPQWLNLRVDAAFGYKSNVFIINKISDLLTNEEDGVVGYGVGKKGDYSISVNPQAAQMVVRNCLDLLFALAKNFPRSFVPYNNENKSTPATTAPAAGNNESNMSGETMVFSGFVNSGAQDTEMTEDYRRQRAVGTDATDAAKLDDSPSTSKAAAVRIQNKAKMNQNNQVKLPRTLQHYNTNDISFWDVLLKIDHATSERLNNVQLFPLSSQPKWEWNNKQPDFLPFNESPFAKLLEMLPYKVICRSPQLTDLLIKLLASLSSELPKEEETIDGQAQSQAAAAQTPVTNTAATSATTTPSATQSGDANIATTPTVTPISTGAKSKKEKVDKDKEMLEEKVQPPKRKMYSKNFSQLQLVIEVLTHQCGTTEGLDNVSKLIVNLSQCSPASNAIFLQYLRAATLGLAQEVREAIQCLLDEIRAYNIANRDKAPVVAHNSQQHLSASSLASSSSSSSNSARHGIMQDRFTSENIVISASSTIKPTCELQLPAMKRLLSGSSAQLYFLRTLKIFMLIRELFESQENNVANNSSTQTNTTTPKPTLSQIICLDDLWHTLSECLVALEDSKDEYAVLVLQPTVEAFFLIHASHKKTVKRRENTTTGLLAGMRRVAMSGVAVPAAPHAQAQAANREVAMDESNVIEPPGDAANLAAATVKTNATATTPTSNVDQQQQNVDRQKFLAFAEKHRTVLNQILRQSPTHLSDGPFAVLVDHTRILDFDVKRKYFQKELERIDEGVRREENTVGVRRVTVFEDSFRVLYRLGPEEWKNRFYIVFEDEEGQDAGGLLREWYVIISREIFNPMYALFCVSPGDRVTYMINPSSHANPNHLSYFKFVGRVIAKAVHDNKLLECYFTRSFYKHILGKQVKYTDMESQDYEFYKGLDYLMKNDISTLGYDLTFSTEVQEFGVTQVRDLITNGRDILVSEENKFEYVQLVCQLKMSDSIRQQLDAFLEGFYDIIPKHLISIFNEQELELLISGLPDIDIEDLKSNTEYHKYTSKSIQIQWFWRALRSFDQADRAKFLQFVTGTSKVPLQGFGSLEGMNGIQKFQIHRDDRSTDRLPCAHTCFNQLDLPMYKSYEKLRSCLLKAIHECSEGFGFA